MYNWWKNLSVSNKLYFTVGSFFLVLLIELIALKFSIDSLSAIRSYQSGESHWAKAQKSSVGFLYMYALSKNEVIYNEFLRQLEIIINLKNGRQELEKKSFDYKLARDFFSKGGLPEEDIPHIISWFRLFSSTPLFAPAVKEWIVGDKLFLEIISIANRLHQGIMGNILDEKETQLLLKRVADLDTQLTVVEKRFVSELHIVALSSERLFRLIIIGILTIFVVAILIILVSGRRITAWLVDIINVTKKVGEGDFNQMVFTESKDEFGQASQALNLMISSLKSQTNERLSAEHASLAKNIFLANMSHEIRTPLNSILGFAELLLEANLSLQERQQYAGIIKRTGVSLISIIRDVLDIARIEAEQITIEMTVFSIDQLLFDLKELLRLKSAEKGIDLIFEKRGKISRFIRSDLTRIRQILLNLLGNSIKFTDSGFVRMEYYVENSHLVFRIQDSGSGIAADQLSSLFRPFSQGDNSVRKKYGGTGLGLMISKRLAQLLGGDATLIESIQGKGSIFEARILYDAVNTNEDLSIQEKKQATVAFEKEIYNKKILVVEDSIDNQILIKIHLTKCGALIDIANDGLAALEKCLVERYDLVIMDMQMPIMDGYSTAQKLRQLKYKSPILALTGFAMKGDEEKCINAGCNAYLAKPFDKIGLLSAVIKTMNQSTDL